MSIEKQIDLIIKDQETKEIAKAICDCMIAVGYIRSLFKTIEPFLYDLLFYGDLSN